jgi:hypothetical protein
MIDITIQDLDLITSPSLLANGDIFHFQDVLDAYTDKGVVLSAIAEFVLREKSIPSVGSAIVTDTATQTLTNKTLTSPKINSATTITANGADINKLSGMTSTTAELNKLHGVTASTAEINHLTGVTSNIQTQINNIANQSQGVTSRIYHYSPGVVSGVTSQIINEATLRAEYGINSSYRVDPDSISVSVYKQESDRWYLLPPALAGVQTEGIIFFSTTTAGPASQTVLNSINVLLSSSESYRIVVNYKVLALAGV